MAVLATYLGWVGQRDEAVRQVVERQTADAAAQEELVRSVRPALQLGALPSAATAGI